MFGFFKSKDKNSSNTPESNTSYDVENSYDDSIVKNDTDAPQDNTNVEYISEEFNTEVNPYDNQYESSVEPTDDSIAEARFDYESPSEEYDDVVVEEEEESDDYIDTPVEEDVENNNNEYTTYTSYNASSTQDQEYESDFLDRNEFREESYALSEEGVNDTPDDQILDGTSGEDSITVEESAIENNIPDSDIDENYVLSDQVENVELDKDFTENVDVENDNQQEELVGLNSNVDDSFNEEVEEESLSNKAQNVIDEIIDGAENIVNKAGDAIEETFNSDSEEEQTDDLDALLSADEDDEIYEVDEPVDESVDEPVDESVDESVEEPVEDETVIVEEIVEESIDNSAYDNVTVFINDSDEEIKNYLNSRIDENTKAYLIDMTENQTGVKIVPEGVQRSFATIEGTEEEFQIADISYLVSKDAEGKKPVIIVSGLDEISSKISKVLSGNDIALGIIKDRVRDVISDAKNNNVDIIAIAHESNDIVNKIIKELEA